MSKEKTPESVFKPKLFSDQHKRIEQEWPGIHKEIYDAMREYAKSRIEIFKIEQVKALIEFHKNLTPATR